MVVKGASCRFEYSYSVPSDGRLFSRCRPSLPSPLLRMTKMVPSVISTVHSRGRNKRGSGEKPFVCPFCPHRSNRKGNMNTHIMFKHSCEVLKQPLEREP
ncbi:hypothetical protein Avbf_00242 [Armadillidium vulgare]|nr:hypothetical protein Avbf_00242 [Armadillidium vulgare]